MVCIYRSYIFILFLYRCTGILQTGEDFVCRNDNFLIICSVFPNGQDLRPVVFERDNIFVDAVRMLYRTDTCTNVFPSLHVFNTLCACIAIRKSQALKKHKAVCIGAYVLGALIIMATMFLKQHSVLDVTGAFIMAYLLYQWVYAEETKKVPGYSKRPDFRISKS